MATAPGTHAHTNRLAKETSPYLLQHAHNPVDWYPWGEEALQKARREEKPIFLSIGYSACHWCHVMERESFENEAIAQVINANFVPIKVDREERPDLDEIYMTATQLMSGSGGWPMSVFLTPALKPFYAGTYFPPADGMFGRVGFRTLCLELGKAWHERRADVERVAESAAESIGQVLAGRAGAADGDLRPEVIDRAVARMGQDFDPAHGGFGRAPKFPPSQRLAFFLRHYRRQPEPRLRQMVEVTLDQMARGGMYDQLGGGFHRYSVDEVWLVPHFEKMLYDNAQLALLYLEAGEALAEPGFTRTARQVLDNMLRQFVHPQGGFYSTFDADSEGGEGKYYVWTPAEVIAALGEEDGEFFNRLFDVTPRGNFEGKSIPNLLRRSLPEWAEELRVSLADLEARVDELRARLLVARERRVPPGLDDKILAGWNGLMIRAFARAHALLDEERYRSAAERAAEFVLTRMRRDGRLLVSFREGEARLNAYLDDYAFLAVGLLDLHAAAGDKRWLEEAKGLIDDLNERFWDEEGGGYFFTSHDHEALIARPKSMQDSAIPSGNAMAAVALARLTRLTGETIYRERATRVLAAALPQAEQFPSAFATMFTALDSILFESGAAPAAAGRLPLELDAPREPARAGDTFTVTVRLALPEGWHVNANPPSEDYLIPAQLEIEAPAGFEVKEIRYPPPVQLEASVAARPLAVYEGVVAVEAVLRASADLTPGSYPLKVVLHYQACTATECQAPSTARGDWKLTVVN